jgi:hypothetical protein
MVINERPKIVKPGVMMIGLNTSIGTSIDALAIAEKRKIKAIGIRIPKIDAKGSRIISF